MPLVKGKSDKAVSANIRELYAANKDRSTPRPRKQIVAIAMRMAGRHKPGKTMMRGG